MPYVALNRSQREHLKALARRGATDGQLLDALFVLAPASAMEVAAFSEFLAGESGAPRVQVSASVSQWSKFGGKDDSETVARPFSRSLARWLRSNMLFSLGKEQLATVDMFGALLSKRRLAGDSCDRAKMEAAIGQVYGRLGRQTPTIVWVSGVPTALTFLYLCRKKAKGRPAWVKRITGRLPAPAGTNEASVTAGLREMLFEHLACDAAQLNQFLQAGTIGAELTDKVQELFKQLVALPETSDGVVISLVVQSTIASQLHQHVGVLGRDAEQYLVDFYPISTRQRMRFAPALPGLFWPRLAPSAMAPLCASALGAVYPPEFTQGHEVARDLATNAWWTWFGENLVLCCEGPTVQRRDSRLRFHAEDGPAIVFGDGVSIYALEGYEADKRAVMQPHTLTVDEIDSEPNADLRRILMARFGFGRYLNETGAEVVHMDMVDVVRGDRAFGAMPRALLRDKRQRMWLVGTDGSTRRVYYMRVPGTVTTCAEAHQALAGFNEDDIVASS